MGNLERTILQNRFPVFLFKAILWKFHAISAYLNKVGIKSVHYFCRDFFFLR